MCPVRVSRLWVIGRLCLCLLPCALWKVPAFHELIVFRGTSPCSPTCFPVWVHVCVYVEFGTFTLLFTFCFLLPACHSECLDFTVTVNHRSSVLTKSSKTCGMVDQDLASSRQHTCCLHAWTLGCGSVSRPLPTLQTGHSSCCGPVGLSGSSAAHVAPLSPSVHTRPHTTLQRQDHVLASLEVSRGTKVMLV